ncbi:MAG TPA: 5-formyltetrahydrofolate cyclo-ligase [Polyangiaceae bacterium]
MDEAESQLRRRVKIELRKRMRGLRMAMPASACAQRSARIVDRLLALDVVASARAVALFWPIEERHEVDLRTAGTRLVERGVRVAYPAIDPETREMLFRFVDRPEAMVEQGFGFREPSAREPEAPPGALDVIVVPALAVDPRGHRIGYGAGYYDRTLPRFAPPAATIAVAFDFQLIADAPTSESEGDVAVGWVVTDSRQFRLA